MPTSTEPGSTRHDGGDPRFVLKDLLEAHDRARAPRPSKVHPGSSYDDSWKIGRPGYTASMLCGVDPPNFQVDTHWLTSGGQFYGDIEFLYLVTAEVVDGKLTWLVEVRVPKAELLGQPRPGEHPGPASQATDRGLRREDRVQEGRTKGSPAIVSGT